MPFSANFYKNGSNYETTFDPQCPLVEGTAGVATYYIDVAAGSDSNPGTEAQPFKTIGKALLVVRATAPRMLLKVKGGTYDYNQSFNKIPEATTFAVVSWDGNPIICSNKLPLTGASWTLDSSNTYWASVAGMLNARFGTTAWDHSMADSFGDDKPLYPESSVANCKLRAGSYYTDTAASRVYVHAHDDRAPDNDIIVYEAWGNPGQFVTIPADPRDAECYFEDCTFLGGSVPFVLQQTSATLRTTAVFKRCEFKYSRLNYLLQVSGNVEVALIDCLAASGHADGFSYHNHGSTPAPRALEINCEARNCGSVLVTSNSNQGSTMHDGGVIVRLNGFYHHNQNDQIADVNTTTRTWMLGCRAENGLVAGYSGYRCNNAAGAELMWLDGCSSTGNTYDIAVESGATVYTRDFTGAASNTGSGTVTSY